MQIELSEHFLQKGYTEIVYPFCFSTYCLRTFTRCLGHFRWRVGVSFICLFISAGAIEW